MTYSNPEAYQQFMGRWSAHLAPLLIRFAGVEDGQRIVDVGCGTGNLSRALLSTGRTIAVTAVDPAAAYVSFARDAITDPRAEFLVGSAEALRFPECTFDAAIALLVLQEMADPVQAVREMARVTRPGGRVAACQWDFSGGLTMLTLFWEAAEAVAPEAVARYRKDDGHSTRRLNLAGLAELWTRCGLAEVTTANLDITMRFGSFDDYWLPFLGGSTPASAFAAALERETEGALGRALRDQIADVNPDGSFVFPARALAVAGRAR